VKTGKRKPDTGKALPLTESRRIANLVSQAIAALPTRKLRRLLRETTQSTTAFDFASALQRLARAELQRRDRRRRQLPLPLV
jgi:hypothetical protein